MKYLQNTKDAHLMVWETNPNKRNINNIINVNVKDDINLQINDCIYIYRQASSYSSYYVKEIKNERKSSISGHVYYTILIEWRYTNASTVKREVYTT